MELQPKIEQFFENIVVIFRTFFINLLFKRKQYNLAHN